MRNYLRTLNHHVKYFYIITALFKHVGELAQMVERSLSMREVPGSMPGFSTLFFPFFFFFFFLVEKEKGTAFLFFLFFYTLPLIFGYSIDM